MNESLPDDRLAEIQTTIPESYDPPWTYQPGEDANGYLVWLVASHSGEVLIATVPDYGEQLAQFIADARASMPQLVAEVVRLRALLDGPCGSCHPCDNYRDETWREAGRTPPHVIEWDDLRAENERLERENTRLEAALLEAQGRLNDAQAPAGEVAR
ncbi:hypothetical protein GCM10009555_018150 [Acrocarpospora macrocephala]|uniref:Uncharacterized protein n=1 Tax=Acrocarpospora macrocephala TaxID=150177 RepID=A0A5M3WEF4_9ACTN|nr:hypothetical protein [Acrocarpospora macrocephala]GES07475.1 hypothetical protein Amac_010700 [Acrocarpospora macrocephala]